MIDKIISFGDSFLAGDDLSDIDTTWPSLISQELGMKHECWARGGCGNQYIASMIFNHASKDTLAIINWTWIDRFDYYTPENQHDLALRPSEDKEVDRFYYKHLHSEKNDKFRSLSLIYSAISWLHEHNIPYIMTIMDNLLLNREWNVDEGMMKLQDNVKEHISWFPNNQTFLEWSRANNYPESDTWHPLEEAHARAAEIMLPIAKQKINTYITTT